MTNIIQFNEGVIHRQRISGGEPSTSSGEKDIMDDVRGASERVRSDISALIGESDPVESYAKDYVDQKIENERLKTDSRFDQVLYEISLLRQASLPKGQFWAGIATSVATILGVLLSVLAFAGDRFDAGVSLTGDISAIEARQSERDTAQDARLNDILGAIEGLRAEQQ